MGQLVSTAAYADMVDYMKKLQSRGAGDWWLLAIQETVGSAKQPGWQYMKAILERWLASRATVNQRQGTEAKADKTDSLCRDSW